MGLMIEMGFDVFWTIFVFVMGWLSKIFFDWFGKGNKKEEDSSK